MELGSHYSTFDEVSPANGAHIDSRLLPAVGVFLDHPLYRNFSLVPTLRYTQQGEKTSWINSSASLAGEEAVLEHTVSTGIEIRYKAAHAAFLSLSPELSARRDRNAARLRRLYTYLYPAAFEEGSTRCWCVRCQRAIIPGPG